MYFTKENCQQIYGKYSISFTIREMPIKSMMGYSGTPVERRKMERKNTEEIIKQIQDIFPDSIKIDLSIVPPL